MKKGLLSTLLSLAVCSAAVILISCSGGDGDGKVTSTDNTMNTDNTTAINETVSPIENGEEVVLAAGKSAIKLVSSDTDVKITSLTSKSGNETVKSPISYETPSLLTVGGNDIKPKWKFDKAELSESGTLNKATFVFADAESSCKLYIICRTHTDVQGPFEFIEKVENSNGETVRITPGEFASVSFNIGSQADAVVIKKESGQAEGFVGTGSTYAGTGIYTFNTQNRTEGSAMCNTFQNWNANGSFPMVYLQGDGHGVYCALEWSSGRVLWSRKGNEVVLSSDMDGASYEFTTVTEFSTRIESGDTFVFPTVYYGAYDGSLDDGSNEFKHWFFDLKVPDVLRDNPNEPLTQMGLAAGTDVTLLNLESIKWEYGWWSDKKLAKNADWRSREGAWSRAEVLHPSYLNRLKGEGVTSLKGYGAKCKLYGENFTVYLLLHDTLDDNGNPTDTLGEFNSVTHPDWFSNVRVADGMGNSADLGNEECVEYLKTALASFFADNLVGTWRTDFEPICRSSNLKNRHDKNGTDVQYWCTVGFRDVVQYLSDNVKGFRYESCSSGGSMKDLLTATIATIINCDDSANYLSLRTTFYDASYIIHPTQLQLPMNSNFFDTESNDFYPQVSSSTQSKDEFKKTMRDMGFRSCIVGPPMMGSWTGKVLYDEISYYTKMYKEKIRPIQRSGELYHILPRPDGTNWDGIMYADPDTENEIKGVVFLFKPSESVSDSYNVVMEGLDESKTYKLAFEDRPEQNTTASGRDLMTKGIDVTIKSVGSEIIWITEN